MLEGEMLLKLFEEQRLYLNYFFDSIEIEQAEFVLEQLKGCVGSLLLTGLGKSGYVARKIAATFASTGTKAIFLSPTDALHGDIGLISSNDLLLVFSKSGETEELLKLIPYVKNKGAKCISVVSKRGSHLEKISDFSLYLPVQRELCPYDLAPTTSTAIQLIFGDCLAVALMKHKEFSLSDFAENHPAGLLGKKITVKVKDLMLRDQDLPLCKEEDLLIDCLHELSMKRSGCLLVVKEKKLQGIFTDGDLRRSIETMGPNALKMPFSKLMIKNPKIISPDQYAQKALEIMEEDPKKKITVLPVLQKGELVGLLRLHDILQIGLFKQTNTQEESNSSKSLLGFLLAR